MVAATSEEGKRRAAAHALRFVRPGMRLGLGTGSTAGIFVDLLAAEVRRGLDVVCVPTSEQTRVQAAGLGIELTTLDDLGELDLAIDGADEFDAARRLIKGGGGALLREKIVAAASTRMFVIADKSKRVPTLGAFPLPVEVNAFGLAATVRLVGAAAAKAACAGPIRLRMASDHVFVTDGGHYILDCAFGTIPDPAALAAALVAVPGVVEHGLFLDLATAVIMGDNEGVEVLGDPGLHPVASS